MDVSYLTTKRGSSSSASPELENIRNGLYLCQSLKKQIKSMLVSLNK